MFYLDIVIFCQFLCHYFLQKHLLQPSLNFWKSINWLFCLRIPLLMVFLTWKNFLTGKIESRLKGLKLMLIDEELKLMLEKACTGSWHKKILHVRHLLIHFLAQSLTELNLPVMIRSRRSMRFSLVLKTAIHCTCLNYFVLYINLYFCKSNRIGLKR